MTRFRVFGLAAAAAVMAASFVTAQGMSPGEQAVKVRHAQMQLFAHNIGTLGAMAQGKMDYDAEAAQTAADNLSMLAQVKWNGYFPEGTEAGAVEGSRALPKIWEDMGDFEAKHEALIEASANMASAAGTDLESLQGAMRELGGSCGGCHESYRQSNN